MTASRVRQAVGVVLCALLAGCSSVPLPGGEGSGGYKVTIEFADVTDLVEYSTVKVDDVTVGQVEDVTVGKKWTASVTCRINGDVDLPQNTEATLRQTSLLGEKFVDLSKPSKTKPVGDLNEGDEIPLDRTDRGAEVEEVLGSLALVLQGGGLEQLRTINNEMSDLMSGREDELKGTLSELEKFVGSLDKQREDIVVALEALEGLSKDLAKQKETIGNALDSIAPGVTELAEQRETITDAITALGDLGDTGSRVISKSGDETVAILNDLKPVLQNLEAAGDAFPQGIEQGLTYPFPHNVSDTIEDDFVNIDLKVDANLESVLGNLLGDHPVTEANEQGGEDESALPGGGEDDSEPLSGGLEDLLGVGVEGE